MKKLSKALLLCISVLMPLTGCNAEADTTSREMDSIFDTAPEFTGLPVFENSDQVSCLNSKESRYQPFCYDSERVYFTNAKDGQYLYSYDGENLECLVEMPVHSLNYYDNCIYFLSDKKLAYFYGYNEGYLYKYDLAENKTEKLSDYLICELHVNDKGIFYIGIDENNKSTVYQFDETIGEGTPMYHSMSVLELNGYHICYEPSEEGLKNYITNNEEAYKLPINVVQRCDCIADGKYYYKPQSENSLFTVDLANGKNEKLPIPDDMPISDYTVFDGTLYIVSSHYLYKLCGGELKKLEYVDEKLPFIVLNNSANIYQLFSAPNAMYTLVEYYEGDVRMYDFTEIILNDDDTYNLKNIA